MGKTSDLSKKIRDTKGTFHVMMGTVKDRNRKDLTEGEEIKMRQQEYTELIKKILMSQVITMVRSLTKSQIYWSVKSSGTQEALL